MEKWDLAYLNDNGMDDCHIQALIGLCELDNSFQVLTQYNNANVFVVIPQRLKLNPAIEFLLNSIKYNTHLTIEW